MTDMQTQVSISKNGKRRGKRRLLTRADLDGRTRAALQFDAIVEGLVADGVDHGLAEAYAGSLLHIRDLIARRMLGEHIDADEQSKANSSLIRLEAKMKKQSVSGVRSPAAPGARASPPGSTPISDLINQQDQKERETAA